MEMILQRDMVKNNLLNKIVLKRQKSLKLLILKIKTTIQKIKEFPKANIKLVKIIIFNNNLVIKNKRKINKKYPIDFKLILIKKQKRF